MKTGGSVQPFLLLILSGLVLMSCLLPGMIPLNSESTEAAEPAESAAPEASAAPAPAESANSMPTMEKDPNVVIESLKAREGAI
jgi:hypothetical protein